MMTNPAPDNVPNGVAPGRSRVLIIDDDRKLCRLIRDYLEPMGYEIEMCHSGPEGLSRAQGEHFHAVILDLMLPGMDGFEVLKKLRHTSDVPVLMLTGRGEEPDRIVGLEIGADDYLPKTFGRRGGRGNCSRDAASPSGFARGAAGRPTVGVDTGGI
jgi:two-component system response regulator CpxR